MKFLVEPFINGVYIRTRKVKYNRIVERIKLKNTVINFAVNEDLPFLLEVVRGCISVMESQGIYQWDDIYPDEKTLRNDIDTKTLWVARIDGRIAGMIVLNEHQEKEYQQLTWQYHGRILVVHRLMIAPAFQNQKLATYLMRFAEVYAAANKYDAIRLDAFVHNSFALRLYQGLEYRQAGIVTFRKGPFHCFEKKMGLCGGD
jgi:ribosomal protein S18 acetylase RimI-like enzyme